MTSAGEYALGIDLGTSGPRVGLFSCDGRLLAHASRRVETLRVSGGGAEQDAEQLWSVTADSIRDVVERSGVAPDQILAIGCCSQYSSVVPVGADARPVGPVIVWMDSRGAAHNREIYGRYPEAFGRWLELHGIMPLPSGGDSLSHILHIQRDCPEIYARTAAFLEPMDYLTARLTGRSVANQCTAFMFLLVDNRTLGSLGYSDELVAMSGVDPTRLPTLVPIQEPLGPVLGDVARELGLAETTLVLPAMNDTQAGSLVAGVWAGPVAGLSLGTTSVLVAAVDRKETDVENQLVSMPGPLVDKYVVMAENGLGGGALDHVLRNFVHADDPLGDHGAEDPFRGLDQAVEQSPPGAGNALFLPWLNGSMAPRGSGKARGGWLNLSLETTRPDLVRAVLEGVALNLRWLLGPVEAFVGQRLDQISFGGGGAVSPAWAQIFADVLERPVRQLAEPSHANCRAMALLALHRLGRVDFKSLASPSQAVFEPRAAQRELYRGLYEQFVAAYEQNGPIFDALNG